LVAVVVFIVGFYARIASLALFVAPSTMVSVLVIQTVEIIDRLHVYAKHGILVGLLQPVSIVNIVCSFFPVVDIGIYIFYYDTDLDFGKIFQYTLQGYIAILLPCLGALCFSTHALIVTLACRTD
jgi:hypothetical protein